jgi:hypothetical protein
MKSIDIIIVNHNSTNCTIKAIDSLKKKTNGYIPKIIVVDNASTDNPEIVSSKFSDVELLINKENLGFSKAINQALRRTTNDYAIMLNPDTVIVNGFVSEMIAYLEEYQDIGIIGPRILDSDGSIQGSARRFPTFWTSMFGRKSPLTKMFPNNPFTRKEFVCFNNNAKEVIDADWVSGACMIIRRKAFEAVGGFDERFFLYWEDTDICKRIKDAGWRIVYFSKAKVIHLIGRSSSTKPIKSIYHFHSSCFKLFQKHADGFQKALIPISFLALSVRCLFVIIWKIMRKPSSREARNSML